MSAIAGIFNLTGQPVNHALLQKMNQAAQHRGQDGNGQWVDGHVGFAAQMHWTTPEATRERQPLVSNGGSLVIVWDGRLDNREFLIGALGRSSGLNPRSTDVDIVLESYRKWGVDCPTKLVGDFAFAIWDSFERRLMCARDPIGVRQFHYYFDGQRFLFGTEIKQVLGASDISREFDRLTIGLYLTGNTMYGDHTFFKSVKRLLGGYVLIASPDGIETRPYWNPDPADEIRYRSESEYFDQFRDLLTEAVRSRLRSKSPVAITLSGGLDSGAITAIAGREVATTGQALRAYHMSYEDNPAPEWKIAQAIATDANVPLDYVQVDDFWAMKESPDIGSLDEPFVLHFEAMVRHWISRPLKDGCEVVIDGEGGDEAFMEGQFLFMGDWLKGGHWLRLWRDYRHALPAYRRGARSQLKRTLFPNLRTRLKLRRHQSIPDWLNDEFVTGTRLTRELLNRDAHRYRDSNYTQSRGYPPFFTGMDSRAAVAGVEIRHPLWDSRIVDFMTRIPPEIRLQGGRTKLMLKKALSNILPSELLGHEPHGAFGALHARGFMVHEVDRLNALFDDSRLGEMGVIDPSMLLSAYRSYRQGDSSQFRGLVWAFGIEMWLRSDPVSLRSSARSTGPNMREVRLPDTAVNTVADGLKL